MSSFAGNKNVRENGNKTKEIHKQIQGHGCLGRDKGTKDIGRALQVVRGKPQPDITVEAGGDKKHGDRRHLPNQVWSIDITYVPMAHGHMYLVAIIDVFSHRILSRKLSNTFDASESVEVLQQATARFGTPEIINSDQGSQYTSGLWAEACGNTMKISVDGRGRAKDNLWIECFWRTIKREYIYMNSCDNAVELRKGIEKFMQ